MKTAKLTGPALDWAVAKCEGENSVASCYYDDNTPLYLDEAHEPTWNPTTNWAQGGPIIEREGMLIEFHGDHWSATMWWDDGDSANEVSQKGPTLLVAAMRCYVASKLGASVDLPDELAEATT